MANVKFVASMDVRDVLRGSRDVARAQDAMERGFGEMGDSAERASAETVAAIKQTAAAYELAERRMAGGLAVRGATSRVTGGARAYGVSPPATRPAAAFAGVPAFAGSHVYGLGRTEQEQFTRWAKAQTLREGRRVGRLNETAGATNLWAMDALLDRGSRVLDGAGERDAARRQLAGQHAEIDRDTQLNKFRQRVAGRDADRDRDRTYYGELGTGAAVAGGVAAVATLRGVEQAMDEARGTAVEFYDAFRPLATLGDNVENITAVRDEVLALGAAWGKSSEQVIDARYSIEAANPDMPPEQRAEVLRLAMEFNATGNTDPQVAGRAISKSMAIFPDTFETPTAAANVIDYLADKGDLNPEELATYLPDLYATASATGFDPIEVGAAYAAVSQKTGRQEPTYTGLKNMMLRSGDAKKKLGKDLGADMPTLLANVAALDTPDMKELFGSESIGVAEVAAQSRERIAEYTAGARAQLAAGADRQGAKVGQMYADPGFRYVTQMQRMDQQIKDMPLTSGYVEEWGGFDTRVKARELGIAGMVPQATPQVVREGIKWGATVAEEVGLGGPVAEFFGVPKMTVNGVDALANPLAALGLLRDNEALRAGGLAPPPPAGPRGTDRGGGGSFEPYGSGTDRDGGGSFEPDGAGTDRGFGKRPAGPGSAAAAAPPDASALGEAAETLKRAAADLKDVTASLRETAATDRASANVRNRHAHAEGAR